MSRPPAAYDAFGASAIADLTTPISGRDPQGSKVDHAEGLEYVTCHLCEYPYSDPKRDGRRFWMMPCKHILCDDSKHGHRRGQCTVCHAMGVTAVRLDKSMPKDVESFFFAPELFAQRLEDGNQKLQYWVQQLKRYISFQKNEMRQQDLNFNEMRRKLTTAEKANGRLSNVENQNQILQQEIAQLKEQLAFSQPHLLPAPPTYRHADPPSHPLSGIPDRPYSSIRASVLPHVDDSDQGHGYGQTRTGGMVEIAEEDEDGNQDYDQPHDRGRKRPRSETPRASGFIPPRNLNVPPPTVLANLPPSTAYVGREQQPQGYRAQEEPSQGEYEEAQVQAYHRPRVSMSTQKPRTNMQNFALETTNSPSQTMLHPHMRPPSRFSAVPGRFQSATPQPGSSYRGPAPFRPQSVGGSKLNPNRAIGIQKF